jgi:hypothetical protein
MKNCGCDWESTKRYLQVRIEVEKKDVLGFYRKRSMTLIFQE